jgi:hypothetical protein
MVLTRILESKNEQEQDYLGLDTRLIVTVIIPVIETCPAPRASVLGHTAVTADVAQHQKNLMFISAKSLLHA